MTRAPPPAFPRNPRGCQSGGAPALRPGAIAQSPGREAALAWASLAQRPGKPNLPLGLRGKAGGGARVTAGPKRPHLSVGKIEGRRRRGQQRMRWLDGTKCSCRHLRSCLFVNTVLNVSGVLIKIRSMHMQLRGEHRSSQLHRSLSKAFLPWQPFSSSPGFPSSYPTPQHSSRAEANQWEDRGKMHQGL